MPTPRPRTATRAMVVCAAAALSLAFAGAPEPADASASTAAPTWTGERAATTSADWAWPMSGPRVVARGFEAPADRYSAGHRGIDIPAATGTEVIVPQNGLVRFAGVVVDRATLTMETADGILISMEPVTSAFAPGDSVERGAALGVVSAGGHCSGACLHLGVRVAGEYVSPLRYFGGVPRAVLLPIRPADARADSSP